MTQSQRITTRRLVLALTFVAALIAAGSASPRAALAYTISGPVCGFSHTFTNDGNVFWLSGATGTVLTVTVTSSPDYNYGFLENGSVSFFLFSNVTSYSVTFSLTDSLNGPGVYGLHFFGAGTITLSISCASVPNTVISPDTVISGDNRLNNNGDQGAQSVAVYCNSDGSLNLIPLQLLNPGPGSTSIKDTKGNNIIVKTAPLSSIKTNASYSYGIQVVAYSDSSWTVYRAELGTTGKTYAYNVQPGQCRQL